jgi:hypothetical protein
VITLADVFEFATLQGNRAIGQERRPGTVEAGKVADVLFVSTISLTMMPVLGPLTSLVFHATPAGVDTTLPRGLGLTRRRVLIAERADCSPACGTVPQAKTLLISVVFQYSRKETSWPSAKRMIVM